MGEDSPGVCEVAIRVSIKKSLISMNPYRGFLVKEVDGKATSSPHGGQNCKVFVDLFAFCWFRSQCLQMELVALCVTRNCLGF